ncbi:MAG: VWA domain-containing protein [Verrucomicrobiota bacterium]
MIEFDQPHWLLIGLAFCAGMVALFWASSRARQHRLESFAARHLLANLTASVSPAARITKQVLLVVGVACLFVAMARPQMGFEWQEVRRRGIDILIGVDVSRSMLAEDIRPNRLERAKLAVTDLVEKLGGDRVGLVAFAGDAFLQCPLTLDHQAFMRSLNVLDTTIIPVGGSDIARAIEVAQEAFASEPGNQKIFVMLTDGEDLEGGALAAAREAAADDMTIYTVGIGSEDGELIPITDRNGATTFVRDERGDFVKSRLDAEGLRQIADLTGGTYEPLGKRGQGLETIYETQLKGLEQRDLASRRTKIPEERFQWPLALGLLLLMLEMMIRERRAPRRRKFEGADIRPVHTLDHDAVPKPESEDSVHATARRLQEFPGQTAATAARSGAKAASRLFMAGGLALALVAPAQAATPQEAEKLYAEGRYEEAEKVYEAALVAAGEESGERPKLEINTGAAAYKAGNFDQAETAFTKALGTPNTALQQEAYYNLGNTLFRRGQQTEQSDPQSTIAAWEQALEMYEGAMALNPEDADAKHNYEVVKKKLEELKQQQQQQNQDQQNQDQQDQDQQDQQNQDQENQDQQNQDQQDQGDQDQQSQDQSDQDQQDQGDQDQQNQDQGDQDQQDQGDQDQQDQQNQGDQQKDEQGEVDQSQDQGDKKEDQQGEGDQRDQQDQGDQKQEQGEGNQPQQPNEPGQEQPADQGQEEKKPQEPGGDQPAGGQPGDGSPQAAADGKEERVPGAMSKEEAIRLLESAETDASATPIPYFYQANPWQRPKSKDW